MLTLYHAPRSRSFRILWLLEELGVPYDTEMVSIRGHDSTGHMPADYIDIHPHRKVPALVHDGVPVFETPAIAVYLTDLFPQAGLGPVVGDPQRGPYLTWLAYSTGVFEPAMVERAFKTPHQAALGWGSADEILWSRSSSRRSQFLWIKGLTCSPYPVRDPQEFARD
ncbi:glutathione S-transferase family protein, partial [Achromobacter animicus]|uniref:glutathione S-transferase family protein n=2 Tax=Achromobacter TaxID=222 RepID=UPI0020C5F6C9